MKGFLSIGINVEGHLRTEVKGHQITGKEVKGHLSTKRKAQGHQVTEVKTPHHQNIGRNTEKRKDIETVINRDTETQKNGEIEAIGDRKD